MGLMAHIAGNDEYYNEIQIEMDATGTPMRDAEVSMLYRVIKKLRMENRLTHKKIAEHLQQVWGLTPGAYYTRLKWIREKYPCP